MKTVRIICRNSRLSLLQAALVKQRILRVTTGMEVEIIGRSSRGDRELNVNLSVLDGTDFFTEDIFKALQNGEADIAVHSLKDMSAAHFFSHNAFAVADRDDVRDVALFNNDIEEKIRNGKTLIIGTCSPRREEMAISFLKKALPQLGLEIKIETRSIRGNVESRLQQLDEGKYDGTILATAGLNRLLRSKTDAGAIRKLLDGKKTMLLPLVECVPAPCQGAIVAEADPDNKEAVELIRQINDPALFEETVKEKRYALNYGTGCLQKFGVTTIHTNGKAVLYAAGEDKDGCPFTQWTSLPGEEWKEQVIFSSTDYMKHFFRYEWNEQPVTIAQPAVFVANHKSVQRTAVKEAILSKNIYAAGTRTWYELARQGVWVNGCADGLGFESFLPAIEMPLVGLSVSDICILTHEKAAERWKEKGYQAISNYRLVNQKNETIAQQIANADLCFWSSYSQYSYYSKYCKQGVTHACGGGETAVLLCKDGIDPIIFPTIKSFEQWRRSFIRQHSAA